jgi:hypothetical protein
LKEGHGVTELNFGVRDVSVEMEGGMGRGGSRVDRGMRQGMSDRRRVRRGTSGMNEQEEKDQQRDGGNDDAHLDEGWCHNAMRPEREEVECRVR